MTTDTSGACRADVDRPQSKPGRMHVPPFTFSSDRTCRSASGQFRSESFASLRFDSQISKARLAIKSCGGSTGSDDTATSRTRFGEGRGIEAGMAVLRLAGRLDGIFLLFFFSGMPNPSHYPPAGRVTSSCSPLRGLLGHCANAAVKFKLAHAPRLTMGATNDWYNFAVPLDRSILHVDTDACFVSVE